MMTAEQQLLAAMIDHTLLKPEATPAQIATLCDEAREYTFASVCVHPCNIYAAADRLRGSRVNVCTVIGFPLGANATETKVFEAELAVKQGAMEVDMVINIGALKAGDHLIVERDIAAVVNAAIKRGAITKVIIETALLTDDEKIAICKLVTKAGAEFIKTSTGFSTSGATVADVQLMKANIGKGVKIKASGGIRDLAFAQELIAAGAERLGTSSGVALVQAIVTGGMQATGQAAGGSY